MPKAKSVPARPATEAEELWLAVLVELENDLAATAQPTDTSAHDGVESENPDAATAGTGMWRAPAQLPPMPATLRARATALHEMQLQRQTELVAERAQVRRHLDALSAVPLPRSASASVYLDIAG